jgi:hypothetical protein
MSSDTRYVVSSIFLIPRFWFLSFAAKVEILGLYLLNTCFVLFYYYLPFLVIPKYLYILRRETRRERILMQLVTSNTPHTPFVFCL